jgi:hypothetical protein
MLELLPTWQFSQLSAPIGTCVVAFGDLMVMPPAVYSAAFAVLWHCTQLVVADGALACVNDRKGKVE